MQYRKFGNTDLQVSEIGFGAWAIGGSAVVGKTPIGWGQTDDVTSKAAIHQALEAGINFFDTADFYGLGHSEELLGEVLKKHSMAMIATKVGQRAINNEIIIDYTKKYIIEACEASLKRLQKSHIDYYQLHAARMTHLQNGECIEAMEQLKQQGKIRYWGLSLNTFHPNAEAKYLMDHHWGDGFQLVFNIINQRAYDIIKKASEKGYGIIARMPLQFGLLTGKFSAATSFTADDHRSFRLTPDVLAKALNVLDDKVWPIAEAEGLTKTQLALSFILSCPQISTIIPGIRTPEHVEQNTTGLVHLNSNEFEYLLSLVHDELKTVIMAMEEKG